MCQRVLIAMAFAERPAAGGRRRADHRARRHDPGAIVQLIAEQQRNAATALLFITHDLRLASPSLRRDPRALCRPHGRARPGPRVLAAPRIPIRAACSSRSRADRSAARALALPEHMPGLARLPRLSAAASRRAARSSTRLPHDRAAALAHRAGTHCSLPASLEPHADASTASRAPRRSRPRRRRTASARSRTDASASRSFWNCSARDCGA